MKLRGNLANEALIAYGAYFALCAVLLFYNVQIANKVIKETEQKHYIHRMTNFCRVIDKCSLFTCNTTRMNELLIKELKYSESEIKNFVCFAKFEWKYRAGLNSLEYYIKVLPINPDPRNSSKAMQIIG